MQTRTKSPFNILVLMITLVFVSACSTIHTGSSQKGIISQGMLSFEGNVFVASTKPSPGLWRLAGWQIARSTIRVTEDQVPKDCTLYPHDGVEDQWIGSCSGHMLIPQDGASHIQVMHTPPNGNTVLIQVAPTPEN